ncbi:pyocin knob domain-containing protein [Paenibacillus pabuli]|uniref:pyocin knob domain-containing protein n=1 Tax=Paenibacillus pabuli TaxID=1472 RepID=UPI0007839D77|nr:pyocin knob domain-containing protein [Paenibacillus pabuli]MEC0123704.1 pyocin knob domain-containing protein [Paenibacillus pabuli]
MPQETDRLKLPLPLGNENVTRESINGIFEKIDEGVATQADLDALREAVSQMDIPDASLTQKGKVQLSSKTDGTSETVAATEKAVRDAKLSAISASNGYVDDKQWQKRKLTQDNGTTLSAHGLDLNTLMTTGFYSGGEMINAPNNQYYYIEVQAHLQGAYVIQIARSIYEDTFQQRRYTSEHGWTAWRKNVYNFQTHKVTQDDGATIQLLNGFDLNSPGLLTGKYRGFAMTNAPDGGWWHINVSLHNDLFMTQEALALEGVPRYRQRVMTNGVWSAWSPDVFQSGVDAKNGIVDAINAKGISASTSETWAVLKDKILAISTISPGSFSIYSAPTGSTTNGSLTLFRGIKISKSGNYKLTYRLVSTGGALATVRYMKDGVQFTSDSTTTGEQTVGLLNIRLEAGQELQIYYFSASAGSSASIQNFTLGIDMTVVARMG